MVETADLDGWPSLKFRKWLIDPALAEHWANRVVYGHPLYDGRVRPGVSVSLRSSSARSNRLARAHC